MIPVICEKSLIRYLLKYVSKAEKNSVALTELMDDFLTKGEFQDVRPRTLIHKMLNKYYGNRDFS